MSHKRLERSVRNRVLSGVLGGLSEYLNIDANLLRIIAIVLFIVSPVIMVVLYLAATLLLPRAGEDRPLASSFNISDHGSLILGFVLFLIGAILLGLHYGPIFWLAQPLLILNAVAAVLLILAGIILMTSHLRKI